MVLQTQAKPAGGTRWHSWLRHCATSQNVAGVLTYSFRPHYGPEVTLASNRNEYQEYFLAGKGRRCVGLANLPSSHASCCEIWDPQPPGTLRACTGIALPKYIVNIHFEGAQCSMKCCLYPFIFCGFILFLISNLSFPWDFHINAE